MLLRLNFIILLLLISSCDDDENECKEVSNDDCACITLYDPVCGCNDKTYGNSCEAQCAGIEDFQPGECQ